MANKKLEILRGAVELVGRAQLAEKLEVPSWVVEAWLCGDVDMPENKLLDLARVLLEVSRPEKK
jgi:hypothetical protein